MAHRGDTGIEIVVSNPDRCCRGVASATLDGVPADPAAIPIVDDGITHNVSIVLGAKDRAHDVGLSETHEGALSR